MEKIEKYCRVHGQNPRWVLRDEGLALDPLMVYVLVGYALHEQDHFNKPKSSPQLLGVFQMLSTAILGGVKVLLAHRRRDGARVASETPPLRDIGMLGSLRAATVLLGLFAISHVAVSFVEAVKSSAPLFTAV